MTLKITRNFTKYPSADILEVGWAILKGDECEFLAFEVHRAAKGSQFARFEEVRKKGGSREKWLFILDPADIPDTLVAMQATAGTDLPVQYVNMIARAFWSRTASYYHSMGVEQAMAERFSNPPRVRIQADPEYTTERKAKEEILEERKRDLADRLKKMEETALAIIQSHWRSDVDTLLMHHRKAEEFRRYLEKRGVKVEPIPSPEQAVSAAAAGKVAQIISDIESAREGGGDDDQG